MVTVTVALDVYPEFADKFLEAAHSHTQNCLTKEKGCLMFIVHRCQNDPNRFFLYEQYETEKDLVEIHNKTPYLAAHRDLTAPWVKGKDLAIWRVETP